MRISGLGSVRRGWRAACALLLGAALLGACDKDGGDEDLGLDDPSLDGPSLGPQKPGQLKDHKLENEIALPKIGDPIYTEKGDPGSAYVATQESGVLEMVDGKLKVVAPVNDVSQIIAGPKGELYLLASETIHRLDGNQLKKIPTSRDETGTSFDRLAVGPKGELWLTHLYGLSRYDGKSWTKFKKEDLKAKGSIESIEVDSNGTVWIFDHDVISTYDGKAWSHAKTMVDSKGFYVSGSLLLGKGKIAAPATAGVMVTDGTKWREMQEPEGMYSSKRVLLGPDNMLVVVGLDDVGYVTMGGGPSRVFKGSGENMKVRGIEDVHVDQLGRIWIASDSGLVVIDKEGEIKHFGPGTLSEMTSPPTAVYVRGDGPEVGKVGAVQTTTVSGKLVKGASPVSGIPVELCQDPQSYMKQGETPCTGAVFAAKGTTGSDGGFSFENVPVGLYKIVWKDSPKWTITMESFGKGMKAGQPFDMGKVNTDGMRF